MGRHGIIRVDDHRYKVVLEDPPSNCVALRMAPRNIENRLKIGRWLVLMVAVWSAPDIKQIDRAVRLARRFPHLMVGVRPFDSPQESRAWLPGAQASQQSPLWILLEDGQIRHVRIGLATDEEIADIME